MTTSDYLSVGLKGQLTTPFLYLRLKMNCNPVFVSSFSLYRRSLNLKILLSLLRLKFNTSHRYTILPGLIVISDQE